MILSSVPMLADNYAHTLGLSQMKDVLQIC